MESIIKVLGDSFDLSSITSLSLSLDLVILVLLALSFLIGLKNHWIRNTIRLVCFVALLFGLYLGVQGNLDTIFTTANITVNGETITSMSQLTTMISQMATEGVSGLQSTIAGLELPIQLPEIPASLSDAAYYKGLIEGLVKSVMFTSSSIVAFVLSYFLSLIIWLPFKIVISGKKKAKAKELGVKKIKTPFWKRCVSSAIRVVFSLVVISSLFGPVIQPVVTIAESAQTALKENTIDTDGLSDAVTQVNQVITTFNQIKTGLEQYRDRVQNVSNSVDSYLGSLKNDSDSIQNKITSAITTCDNYLSRIQTIETTYATQLSGNQTVRDDLNQIKTNVTNAKNEFISNRDGTLAETISTLETAQSTLSQFNTAMQSVDQVSSTIAQLEPTLAQIGPALEEYGTYITGDFNFKGLLGLNIFGFIMSDWGVSSFTYGNKTTSVSEEIGSLIKTVIQYLSEALNYIVDNLDTLFSDGQGGSYLDSIDDLYEDFQEMEPQLAQGLQDFESNSSTYSTQIGDINSQITSSLSDLEQVSGALDDIENALSH